MKYKITDNITESMLQPILNLIRDSFQEHVDNGLNFTCSSYTIKDLKEKILGNDKICFIAINGEGLPIGITSAYMNVDSKSAYATITAISPMAKGQGVGSALYEKRKEYLKSIGCQYVISDTSVKAKSSVNWHLKKCMCSKVGYISFPSTNYFSYIFREDFVNVSWFKKHIYYKIMFIYSYLKTRAFYKENGQLNIGGIIAKKIIR